MTIIKREKTKPRMRQTELDEQREIARRKMKGIIFDQMLKKLQQLGMNSFLQFAEAVAKKKCVHIDRLVRRQRDSLICWFCENCLELLNEVPLTAATNQQPLEPILPPKRNEFAFFEALEQNERDWEWLSNSEEASF
jgi:hypothetical protein